ncbi:hypothetical protein JNB71_15785 [Rhizobium herbae]|uniref:ABC transmembrane type-1 domain-containing protein n=1 Tax=Rhizobium herbae TaxID=508661 RepID=A0ABS7HD71_9HYPH|nr:hypothetical protein [Rhizobium herbae]MBW9064770.1 hypothetical protein [Rhizobium herbae]
MWYDYLLHLNGGASHGNLLFPILDSAIQGSAHFPQRGPAWTELALREKKRGRRGVTGLHLNATQMNWRDFLVDDGALALINTLPGLVGLALICLALSMQAFGTEITAMK